MTSLQDRVKNLLALRNLSQAEATRRAGFKNTAFINDIVSGKKQSVRGPALLALAEALDTTPDYLSAKTDQPDIVRPVGHGRRSGIMSDFIVDSSAPEIDKSFFRRDVPLISMAAYGDETSLVLNGETGDYVRRPPGLEGKRSVYAVNVYGDSMWPAFRHGQLIYVDPNREPGPREDAIIELYPDGDTESGRGFLKRVVKVTAQQITCEQYNPLKEITFDRQSVKAFHRVIPWEEVLGY